VALAQYELLISYLKIFLINASRIKIAEYPNIQGSLEKGTEPFILQNLKDAIEQYYKEKHTASDYAELLNISSSALAKISKTHFNKTLTDLISERIIIEAKRELYLTSKAVKQIAYDLGFNDEHYFSRFFKKNADISPQIYRDTVGFARAEM
jgi:YesN/AraC family two-component response regulator